MMYIGARDDTVCGWSISFRRREDFFRTFYKNMSANTLVRYRWLVDVSWKTNVKHV